MYIDTKSITVQAITGVFQLHIINSQQQSLEQYYAIDVGLCESIDIQLYISIPYFLII